MNQVQRKQKKPKYVQKEIKKKKYQQKIQKTQKIKDKQKNNTQDNDQIQLLSKQLTKLNLRQNNNAKIVKKQENSNNKQQIKKIRNNKQKQSPQTHTIKYQFLNLSIDEKSISQGQSIQINKIWRSCKQQQQNIIRKTLIIKYIQKITFKIIKKLKPKHWLNDQIVNSYIQLLEQYMKYIQKRQLNSYKQKQFIEKSLQNTQQNDKIKLMLSYFTNLISTPNKITNFITKKNLQYDNILIIPINQDLHWFFVIIYQQNIYIMDSLLPSITYQSQQLYKKITKQYCQKRSIVKCIELVKILKKNMLKNIKQDRKQQLNQKQSKQRQNIKSNNHQNKSVHVKLIKKFPQQNNGYDCGVMMLWGIRNFIIKYIKQQNIQSLNKNNESQQQIHQIQVYQISNRINYDKIDKIIQQNWEFNHQDNKLIRFIIAKQFIEEQISSI